MGCWLSEVLTPLTLTLCLSATLHTPSLSHYTSVLSKLHTLPVFVIRAQAVAVKKKKKKKTFGFGTKLWSESAHCRGVIVLLFCLRNRRRTLSNIQSFGVHSASGASSEACSDGGDQEHRHPHLAVQPSRGRGRCHLLHHRGLQVSRKPKPLEEISVFPPQGLGSKFSEHYVNPPKKSLIVDTTFLTYCILLQLPFFRICSLIWLIFMSVDLCENADISGRNNLSVPPKNFLQLKVLM